MQYYIYNDHLAHHGILGMRWGIRRFQPYPKGHRGGKEIGEAAKAKTERREGPSKVKMAANKIKEVVSSKEFKTATKVVGMGAAAAVGTAFITSPQGQAILDTAVQSGIKIVSDVKEYLNNKAWDAANSWNSWIDKKLGVDFAKTDTTLANIDRKIKKEDEMLTRDLSIAKSTIESDVVAADVALKKVSETLPSVSDKIKNDPATQQALKFALQELAIKYASEKSGLSEGDLKKGIEIANKLSIS